MRRNTSAAVAATVAALLLLAGCSGSDDKPAPKASASAAADAAPKATPADIAALKAVKVAGDAGAEPKVTFKSPFEVTAPVARVTAKGTGKALDDGQVLSINYIAFSGADGSTQNSTYKTKPDSITLGDASLIGALNEALAGQKIGARILLALPAPAEPAEGQPTGSTLMAIEVAGAKSIPQRAEGAKVEPAAGLPAVTLDKKTGAPSIKPVEGAAPTELVVQPLITGTGAKVETGQTVSFQYSGWLWDGTPFDSSWEKGTPFSTALGTGAVIKGWDEGLVGQTVGSQVLLVVPPALGYGEKAQGPIPANSTLIFVVDILAAG